MGVHHGGWDQRPFACPVRRRPMVFVASAHVVNVQLDDLAPFGAHQQLPVLHADRLHRRPGRAHLGLVRGGGSGGDCNGAIIESLICSLCIGGGGIFLRL